MMKNKKILIVGLGLIGGSYAEGLTDAGYYVGAIDNKTSSIEYGLTKGIIKNGQTIVTKEYVSQFDIIVFALYPHLVIEWIKQYQSFIKTGSIITDVTGVKKWLVEEIDKVLDKRLEFIGAHPMAGKEVYGVENSNKEIFKGANYIITPTINSSEYAIAIARKIGEELGFKNIVELTIEKHDEMIGFLSQLTHCIAISLMVTKESSHLVEYTGDSFRDLTRIAKINENMWTELFLLNKEELLKQMELFSIQFDKLKEALKNENTEELKRMMIESTKRRKYFDK